MYPILVNGLNFQDSEGGADDGCCWDAEEQLHTLARWHALEAAHQGHQRQGRGAVIVPWPPEERLALSFLDETACTPLGPDVRRRVATYEPRSQFVMVFLLADGDADAYTYRVPSGGYGAAAYPPTGGGATTLH